MAEVEPHPLEDEDILVMVTLTHQGTQLEEWAVAMAPADGGMDVSEAVQFATKKALDKLLAAIEQRGG